MRVSEVEAEAHFLATFSLLAKQKPRPGNTPERGFCSNVKGGAALKLPFHYFFLKDWQSVH
jgi:hypothetical protein